MCYWGRFGFGLVLSARSGHFRTESGNLDPSRSQNKVGEPPVEKEAEKGQVLSPSLLNSGGRQKFIYLFVPLTMGTYISPSYSEYRHFYRC